MRPPARGPLVLLVAVAFALPSIVLPNSPLPSQSATPCSPEPRLRTPSPVRAVSTQPHRASTDYPQLQSKWCLSIAGLPVTLPCALPGPAAAYQRGPAGSQHGATRPAPGELSRSACHCRGDMRILPDAPARQLLILPFLRPGATDSWRRGPRRPCWRGSAHRCCRRGPAATARRLRAGPRGDGGLGRVRPQVWAQKA